MQHGYINGRSQSSPEGILDKIPSAFHLWPVRANKCGRVKDGQLHPISALLHQLFPCFTQSFLSLNVYCLSFWLHFPSFGNSEKMPFLNVSPVFELSLALSKSLAQLKSNCPFQAKDLEYSMVLHISHIWGPRVLKERVSR